ncbi:MAG: LiaF-related protein [Gemmatimonadales bacterium]|jgi:hypothetical protein
MKVTAVCIGIALAVTPQFANGQSWQTLSTSRQVRGESQLLVEVEFASGTLRLRPGRSESLFRIATRYDEDWFDFATDYDPRAASLRVKLAPEDLDDIELDDDSPQYLDLELSPTVPVSLDLKFGAAKSTIDLGGLALHRADIKTGASEAHIGFERSNRVRCEELSVAVGAAELIVTGIGNARCQRVKLAGGAGDVTLDFTGDWDPGTHTEAEVTMGFGGLTLRIPEDVGVELTMNRLFASVETTGFEKRGSHLVSTNYDDARATVKLHVRAILGDVSVDWLAAR